MPERVTHARANGARSDRRMPHRKPRRGGPHALCGIAERHDAAGDQDRDRHAVERVREPRDSSPFSEDEYAGASVRQLGDCRPYDPGSLEELG